MATKQFLLSFIHSYDFFFLPHDPSLGSRCAYHTPASRGDAPAVTAPGRAHARLRGCGCPHDTR
jgi:hypothetical protein